MKDKSALLSKSTNRRTFFKKGAVAAGAATLGGGLLTSAASAYAQDNTGLPITRGDIAILRFLSAAEQVEADLWIQYAELGGATDQNLSPIDLAQNGRTINTGLAPGYIAALEVLDGDMPQYIVDNTDDEISHHAFLNNYLEHREYGRFPFCFHRAGRHELVSQPGPKSDQSRSPSHLAQYRADRNHALPDLARQGRQRSQHH